MYRGALKEALINWPPRADNAQEWIASRQSKGLSATSGSLQSQRGELIRPSLKDEGRTARFGAKQWRPAGFVEMHDMLMERLSEGGAARRVARRGRGGAGGAARVERVPRWGWAACALGGRGGGAVRFWLSGGAVDLELAAALKGAATHHPLQLRMRGGGAALIIEAEARAVSAGPLPRCCGLSVAAAVVWVAAWLSPTAPAWGADYYDDGRSGRSSGRCSRWTSPPLWSGMASCT